jgi:hypothetical protein
MAEAARMFADDGYRYRYVGADGDNAHGRGRLCRTSRAMEE